MRVSLSIIATMLTACGASSSAVAPRPAEPPAPTPVIARVHLMPPGSFGVGALDGLLEPASIERLSDPHWIFGGWRVERLGSGRSVVAEDAFLSPVADAARCGDGWVFVTSRGTIAYAATFTGPLHPIGSLVELARSRLHGLRTNEGVVLYDDEHGHAVSGPCAGPMRTVDAVPGDLVSAVWGARARRLAIVGGRHLYRSEDEGQTWARVALADGMPFALSRSGRVAVGDDRWIRVDAAGQVAPVEAPDVEDHSWVRPVEVRSAPPLEDAAARASTALLRQRAEARAMRRPRLADGAFPLIDPSLHRLGRVDGGAVRWVDLPGSSCAGVWLGRRYVVDCEEVLAVTDDARQLREVAVPPHARGRRWRPADDGVHLVYDGPCVGAVDHRSLCLVSTDTGEARTVEHPLGAELIALHGDHAVFIDGTSVEHDVLRLDVRSGQLDTLWSDSHRDWPTIAGRVGSDGAFLGVIAWEPEPPRLLRDDATGRVSPELPANASHVGFVDTRYGVAAGETSDELWVTEDGAESWHPVPSPFEETVALRVEDRPLPVVLPCDANGCEVGLVWVERAVPARRTTRWVVPRPRPSPGPAVLGASPLRLTCESASASSSSAPRPSSAERLRIEPARDHRVVVWSGVDAEGTFTTRSAPVRPAQLADGELSGCAPVAFDRRVMLMRCCGYESSEYGVEQSRCQGVLVTGGGDATSVPEPDQALAVGERFLVLVDLDFRRTTVVSEIGPDGPSMLAAWRWPEALGGSGARSVLVHLGTLDGEPAIVRQLRRRGAPTAFVERLDGAAPAVPVALPPTDAVLPVCAVSAMGGVELLVDGEAPREDEGATLSSARLTLRLDGERTCIRAVQNEVAGVSLRAEDGRLRGTIDGRPASLSCTVTRVPNDTVDAHVEPGSLHDP